MPWNGKQFADKHNHKLSGARADKAAKQATAMVRSGVPEGEAIAIANKRAAQPAKPSLGKLGLADVGRRTK
jgi:uncharacterized protein YdaT